MMHFQHRATDRLRAISLHTQQQQQPEHVQQLSTNSTSASSTSHHQRTELSRFLNGENTKYRDEVFEFLKSEPIFELDYNLSKEALRHVTRARLQRLVEKGYTGVPPNDSSEMEKFAQYGEAISFHDSSVNTLIGAHFVLFSGSIQKLGTEVHQPLLKKASTCELRGCFALTELGHGSNVRGIETTAIYDQTKEEFIIHTPTETAQKYWIGGGSEWAQMATVFAQLYVNNVYYGVHAFLVPLRDDNGKILPGIRIKDCGHKMGINGVDNGRFWFDKVRIPRTGLLDRFGHVTKEGEYISSIENNDIRFAVTMGNLLTGRVSISRGSTNVCKIALATAIHYGFTRRQFGPGEETPIIEYMTHQVRLMPLLATTYAHHFISKQVSIDFIKAQESFDINAIKEVHVLISGLKALTTWHLTETLQTCRETCGGQGYKSSNRIGILKADADIQVTYEGDNYVLLQQVCKDLAKGNSSVSSQLKSDLELKQRFDENYLCQAENQEKAFVLRASDHISRFREAFQAKKKEGLSSDDAMQACAVLAAEAGRTHIESTIFRYLCQVEKGAPVTVKTYISAIRNLYALTRFDSSPSFLRNQYFTVEKQNQISIQFQKACVHLKKISIPLVDAFEVPPHLLGTIAGDWVESNSFFSEDPR